MEPEEYAQARDAIRDWIAEPGELEVDEDEPVRETDTGYWVQCWAFIDKENV